MVHADNDLILYEPSRIITFTPSTQTRREQRATVYNMTSALPPITIFGAGLSGLTLGLCLNLYLPPKTSLVFL